MNKDLSIILPIYNKKDGLPIMVTILILQLKLKIKKIGNNLNDYRILKNL